MSEGLDIARHQALLELARRKWKGEPICPDCYHPQSLHNDLMVCAPVILRERPRR
jgi:hypothetical protein